VAENFFQLFSLPEQFDIDLDNLNHRYRDLQRACHPDRFVNASERERLLSVQKSSLINDAFQRLKNPVKRAQYLLELNGSPMDEGASVSMDSAFLMEQMSLRDQLSEIPRGQSGLDQLDALLVKIEKKIKELHARLSRLFIAEKKDIAAAKDAVRKLQFYNKLKEEAQQLEARLLDE